MRRDGDGETNGHKLKYFLSRLVYIVVNRESEGLIKDGSKQIPPVHHKCLRNNLCKQFKCTVPMLSHTCMTSFLLWKSYVEK